MNIKRIIFLLFQPLVQRTNGVGAVSDLFIWRNSDEWKTFFDLIDLKKIVDGAFNDLGGEVIIRFYSKDGIELLGEKVIFGSEVLRRINISNALQKSMGEMGLFSVTHLEFDGAKARASLGINIADRGYVSYAYKQAPLKSYVHGNFDAIAYKLGDGVPASLMGTSLLKRRYNLQYLFKAGCTYEIFLTNPTRGRRAVAITFLDMNTGAREESQNFVLPIRGLIGYKFTVPKEKKWTMIIESRLVMARPVIFQIFDGYADVFHG